MSPTQKSLRYLRAQGYTVDITEHWNAHARKRKDLYGCIDLLAIGNGRTVAIQTTSYGHGSEREKKIRDNPALSHMLESGWLVQVHEWKHGEAQTPKVREID